MSESIYQIDVAAKSAVPVAAVTFAEIGVKERGDLQEWILKHPDMLGEPLLVITSEFDSFDRSSKRLDILALDKAGTLTIVELKLTAVGTHADLQAIRYAAFCSTMTMDQVLVEFAKFHQCDQQEAGSRIAQFLSQEELPKLGRQPRIILAAGSMDDQEMTGAVLWLRQFGLNIQCLELKPYRMPAPSNAIVVVPRTVIPIPEAVDFMVRVEQKEAAENQNDRITANYAALWSAVAEKFNRAGVIVAGRPFRVDTVASRSYQQIPIGVQNVHYEWLVRQRSKALDVALHFEFPDEGRNQSAFEPLASKTAEIGHEVAEPLLSGPFGDFGRSTKYREVRFRIESDDPGNTQLAERAADLMKVLIERTYPVISRSLAAGV